MDHQSQGGGDDALRAEDIQAAQPRVGGTPHQRLDWAVRFAYRPLDGLTRGDWSNVRLELTAFAGVLIREHDVDEVGRRSLTRRRPERDAPAGYSPEDVQTLHREFARIIGDLLRSDRVDVGMYELTLTIERFPVPPAGSTRPVRLTTSFPPGTSRATHVLAHLLGLYGHLVKECPAPLARGARDERCGRWFVAARPNQVYCSARCQSRATTRASRSAVSRGKRPLVSRRRPRPTRAGLRGSA